MGNSEIKEPYLSKKFLNGYLEAYKVIIAVSRNFEDYEYMCEKLNDLFYNSNNFKKSEIKIISGMANGADSLAIRYADEHKLTKILFPCKLESISSYSWFP